MTDKEKTIIDGVDVGGCSVYKNGLCLVTKNKCNAVCDYASYYLREQLARKTQECEQKEEKYEALKLENEEGYEIVAELKQECEELKKQLKTSEKWRINAESLNEKLDIKNIRYREALEEIEKATKINCEEICGRKFEDCNDFLCPSKNIIDIINKAKGEE